MGSRELGTIVFIGLLCPTLFLVCYGLCSACPFQWTKHKCHCYRYFAGTLPLEEAVAFCRSYGGRRAGVLTQPNSTKEILFLMDHVEDIFGGPAVTHPASTYLWLNTGANEIYDKYNLIYFNALNAMAEENCLEPCDASMKPSVAVTLSEDDTGVSKVVSAPELVEHRCAVYTGSGAYLDLGDFAGTCVSDPDVCVSNSVTWSLWLKMNSLADLSGSKYFLSTGGRTSRARGVTFLHRMLDDQTTRFLFGVRSFNKSWTWLIVFAGNKIPMDRWINLAATVDLTQTQPTDRLTVYLDGQPLAKDSTETAATSEKDNCTRLYLSHANPCVGKKPDSSKYGASAAYSNLMVFDSLLTPQQIMTLYACGSLDWRLKVRSIYAKSSGGNNFKYVCTASAATAPSIYWRVYNRSQARWEELGSNSFGNGLQITPTSLSTCVVQSVLVMDGGHNLGDIILCTASNGSVNASLYLRQGKTMTVSYSDHNKEGLFVSNISTPYYYRPVNPSTISEVEIQRNRSYICKKPVRRCNVGTVP